MSTVQMKRIDEVISCLIDYRGKTPRKTDSGIKLITAKVIKGGRIVEGAHEYIDPGEYDIWMRRGLPQINDVLITTEAPLGEVAQLRSPEKIALAQRVILLRANPEIIDPRFLYYSLQSPLAQAELQRRSTGTTVLGIKQSELRATAMPIHEMASQQKIVSILSAYDDLIENNTRRIQILEEMAQGLYREWFVKFRFPGHEDVKRDDGSIDNPYGWSCRPISDVVEIVRIGINPGNAMNESFLHFSLPAFDEEQLPIVESGELIKSNKFVVKDGCVLLSKLNPRSPRVWLPRITVEMRAIASTEFLVLNPKGSITREFLYCWLTSIEFSAEFASLALGTSTSHQRVKPQDFLAMVTLLPPDELIRLFTLEMQPVLSLIHSLRVANNNLRRTRDLLLPKLISGQIDVSALEIDMPREPGNVEEMEKTLSKTTVAVAAPIMREQPEEPQLAIPGLEVPVRRKKRADSPSPRPIDDLGTEEVMAAFRKAARGRGAMEREELLKEVATVLGYKRLGARVEEGLRGHLRAAVRRKIIGAEGSQVWLETPAMDTYERDELIGTFRSVMRIGKRYERDEVIRAVAGHLGFKRLAESVEKPIKLAIRSALREGILEKEGNLIWREA